MADEGRTEKDRETGQGTGPSMAQKSLGTRFSAPHRYLLRVLIFLALAGFFVFIFQTPITTAFNTNPGLNGLICGTLAVGILIGLNELRHLYREARTANAVRLKGDSAALGRSSILSPLAPAIEGDRAGEPGLSSAQASLMLESVAVRLDDGREVIRYLAGLLVFLGLLGTFWGLLETVGSVGKVIKTLRTGGEASVLFDELKSGLAEPLAGMGLSFSSSLFGIAGSLVLGFIDLQIGQAQRRLRNQIEDWLGAIVAAGRPLGHDPQIASPASEIRDKVQPAATTAMANLAEGIQGLVQHMRNEQQLIRDWVEAQAAREKDLKQLLERMVAERAPAQPMAPVHNAENMAVERASSEPTGRS